MKDYNLRSRDIYGEPQQRGGRRWAKLVVVLVVVAAATVGFVLLQDRRLSPETTPTAVANPDIIPLAIPPRASNRTAPDAN